MKVIAESVARIMRNKEVLEDAKYETGQKSDAGAMS